MTGEQRERNRLLEEWLITEFRRLHSLVEEKPISSPLAYKEICKLLAKIITQKLDTRVEAFGDLELKITINDKVGKRGKDVDGPEI
jgi:hypothetical protein